MQNIGTICQIQSDHQRMVRGTVLLYPQKMDARQSFWTNGICYHPFIPTSTNGDCYIPIVPTFEHETNTKKGHQTNKQTEKCNTRDLARDGLSK